MSTTKIDRISLLRQQVTSTSRIAGEYARPEFQDYIFNGGCVAIDKEIATIFWVFDND